MTEHTLTTKPGPIHFGKTFLALLGLGLAGILSLIPTAIKQIASLPAELMDLPPQLAAVLALVNPLILLMIAIVIGNLLAQGVGLRSLVAEKVSHGTPLWPQIRPHLTLAFGMGFLFAFAVLGLDAVMNPFENTEMDTETATLTGIFSQLLLGLLYGGIVEELLLRWGVMSLLVWLGWRIILRKEGQATPSVVWMAIILASLLFGIGHLPALANMVELTPLLIFRTILLNALGGILFGWLYWRRGLELAMVAHAAAHVGFFVVNLATFALKLS
ncbi:CPBP family intramembrane glutamic endopeptidase [Bellilinea sp.]